MLFEKIYVANVDEVSLAMAESFIMCGDKNWDYYFSKKDSDIEVEELNNVFLKEFDSKSQFQDYIKDIDCVDFYAENNKFGILHYGEN